jgi:hypothetical protein
LSYQRTSGDILGDFQEARVLFDGLMGGGLSQLAMFSQELDTKEVLKYLVVAKSLEERRDAH